MRVLHVIPHLGPGGAERFLLALLKALSPPEYDCRLVVLGTVAELPGGQELPDHVTALGYGGSRRDVAGLLRCLLRFRRLLRRFDPAVVHSHLWPACDMAAIASAGMRLRHVHHVQDTRPWLAARGPKPGLRRLQTRLLAALAKPRYVAVSRAVRNYTCRHLGIPETSVRVIHNGVDMARFRDRASRSPRPKGSITLGVLARLSPEKGHDYLLKALHLVVERGVEARLLVAGTGSLLQHCVEQVADLEIADRVSFLGHVTDVPAWLASVDVLVLPSVAAEGLPLSILEGMAMGLPVIATDVAGASEAIVDGVNGILVPPTDAGALAGAVERLAGDVALAEKIGREAREHVDRKFSMSEAVEAVRNLYGDMRLSGGDGGRPRDREDMGPA